MPIPKHCLQRYEYFKIMRNRGWKTGSLVQHKATGAVVMIGVACNNRPGLHNLESFYVMIDSRRERWRVGKLVEECE